VSSNREGNDREKPKSTSSDFRRKIDAKDWVWGPHAVEAALNNPARPNPRQILATAERARDLVAQGRIVTLMKADEISARLPAGAVHQGIAIEVDPPESVDLASLCSTPEGIILMLDQVTDPQNVGAIFRSAAAFGVRAIILQERNSPPLSGALAKAAAGGLDRVNNCAVTNLSRALETLSDHGWRVIGLDGSSEVTLEEVKMGQAVVLVLGSEGFGLRRLVSEHCDDLARIDMPGGFESLNVSAAAAVALYASRKSLVRRDA